MEAAKGNRGLRQKAKQTTYRGGRQRPPKPPASQAKKRGRPKSAGDVPPPTPKKIKLEFRHSRGTGDVLSVGQGDTGQLGLGEDVMERSRPGVVGGGVGEAVDLAAGGMHTVCLNKDGEVWTFGCNDEGALGRAVAEEEECFLPGKVAVAGRVVQISAGDSHSAALTDSGLVLAWGTFRDSSGSIGLLRDGVVEREPVTVLPGVAVKKISSGTDHLVMLGMDGELYSLGNSEQGQLGRVSEKFAQRGGRRGLGMLLKPDKVRLRKKSAVFTDVWAGSYDTFALTSEGEVFVMGLNNYHQLGVAEGLTFFMPTPSPSFSAKKWQQIALGQHHALALDDRGEVYAVGRSDYGRLGLGSGAEGAGQDAEVPTRVPTLVGVECVEVACGTAVSYAVSRAGDCFSWGMGTNGQLGTGGEDDLEEPAKMRSKALACRAVFAASSGGQHTVLIATNRERTEAE